MFYVRSFLMNHCKPADFVVADVSFYAFLKRLTSNAWVRRFFVRALRVPWSELSSDIEDVLAAAKDVDKLKLGDVVLADIQALESRRATDRKRRLALRDSCSGPKIDELPQSVHADIEFVLQTTYMLEGRRSTLNVYVSTQPDDRKGHFVWSSDTSHDPPY